MGVEIKAGAELDRAVAESVGWEAKESNPWEHWDVPPAIRITAFDEDGKVHWIGGGPSTDLNAAFEAAEKVGLLQCFGDDGHSRYLIMVRETGMWRVMCSRDDCRLPAAQHGS